MAAPGGGNLWCITSCDDQLVYLAAHSLCAGVWGYGGNWNFRSLELSFSGTPLSENEVELSLLTQS